MSTENYDLCPQLRRAIKLLIPPGTPAIDRELFIKSMPGPTPDQLDELKPFLLQVLLALLENLDKDTNGGNNHDPDYLAELRTFARKKAYNLVPSLQRASDARILANSIRQIIALTHDGAFDHTVKAREAMRVANHAALTDHANQWINWAAALRLALDELAKLNRFTTLSQYKTVWTAIAEGLEEIA